MNDKPALCELCGEPMPAGEEMFKYHGLSGPCPVPAATAASQPADAVAKVFKTTVLGVGPWCVEFADGEIVTTRSEERAYAIAAIPRTAQLAPDGVVEAVAKALFMAALNEDYVGHYRFHDGDTELNGRYDLSALARAAIAAMPRTAHPDREALIEECAKAAWGAMRHGTANQKVIDAIRALKSTPPTAQPAPAVDPAAIEAARYIDALLCTNTGNARDEAWDLASKHLHAICRALLAIPDAPRAEDSDLAKRLRDIAAKTVNVDDHIDIHLAADTLSATPRDGVVEALREARNATIEECKTAIAHFSKSLTPSPNVLLAEICEDVLNALKVPTP